MSIYHFSQLRLGSGSVIEPGNFGRLLKRYVPGNPGFGNGWLLARELVFEQLRPSAKPTRFEACYACPTREDAEKYRQYNDRNFQQVLHEVELVDPTSPQHIGGLSFLDMSDGVAFLDPVRLYATNYWSGEVGDETKGKELITSSSLRVVRTLE